MPSPYSYDLRQKALSAIEQGHSIVEVSGLLGIGQSTLFAWRKRLRDNGSLAARQGYQTGHSHIITDWEKFRAFANPHGDKTQAHMAQLWDAPIGEDTIGRALKRIGVTRKKRAMPTANEMKPSELNSSTTWTR